MASCRVQRKYDTGQRASVLSAYQRFMRRAAKIGNSLWYEFDPVGSEPKYVVTAMCVDGGIGVAALLEVAGPHWHECKQSVTCLRH